MILYIIAYGIIFYYLVYNKRSSLFVTHKKNQVPGHTMKYLLEFNRSKNANFVRNAISFRKMNVDGIIFSPVEIALALTSHGPIDAVPRLRAAMDTDMIKIPKKAPQEYVGYSPAEQTIRINFGRVLLNIASEVEFLNLKNCKEPQILVDWRKMLSVRNIDFPDVIPEEIEFDEKDIIIYAIRDFVSSTKEYRCSLDNIIPPDKNLFEHKEVKEAFHNYLIYLKLDEEYKPGGGGYRKARESFKCKKK